MKKKVVKNSKKLWQKFLPRPNTQSHKYTRGHLIVIGSKTMTGAGHLVSLSARRVGAGVVTMFSPPESRVIYARLQPGLLIKIFKNSADISKHLKKMKVQAVAVGSGLAATVETRKIVAVLKKFKLPMIIDGGALTAFKDKPATLFKDLPKGSVLTPHEGEFKALFKTIKSGSKVDRAIAAAKMAGCVVVYKGAETVITTPDGKAIVNTEASPYLATAGSGDVLAGMIAGLMTQGMDTDKAAAAAVFLHGAIGKKLGPGLIAEDLVDGVGPVLEKLI